MSENLIEVKKLVTQFSGKNGTVTAVDGVSFHVKRGETLGIVGESGCGKSVTSMSILRLIPKQTGKIASGEILFEGRDLAKLSEKEMRQIRGNEIAMIFQDSMTGLNPVMTIGKQLVETITAHSKMDKKEAWARAEEMLTKVGIPSPAQRLKEFPHQLSGGMRQRVMIAMALSCNASLFIADEPTAGLDVEARNEILDMLRAYIAEDESRSILITSHISTDLESLCDELYLIHDGKLILHEATDAILEQYGILKVSEEQYRTLDQSSILKVQKENYGYACFTNDKKFYQENYPQIAVENGGIDELILMMTGGYR